MNKFEKVSFEQFAADAEKLMGLSSEDELVKDIYNEISIPKRGSSKSAGYDIKCPFYLTIDPDEDPVIVPTGLKCQMNEDTVLTLVPRSSAGIKKGAMLANTMGVIDSDYFNNESNEGHIMLALKNMSNYPWAIEAGDRVVQGIFLKYETTEDDETDSIRTGGIGSTGV